MIGAKDDAEALREAYRSTDCVIELARWSGERYEPCAMNFAPNRSHSA